jgi:pilus assembly protein Flp/PilA
MVTMKTYLRKIVTFINGEEGASATEYVLLVTLIAVAILAGATTFGTSLSGMYDRLASQANSLIN